MQERTGVQRDAGADDVVLELNGLLVERLVIGTEQCGHGSSPWRRAAPALAGSVAAPQARGHFIENGLGPGNGGPRGIGVRAARVRRATRWIAPR